MCCSLCPPSVGFRGAAPIVAINPSLLCKHHHLSHFKHHLTAQNAMVSLQPLYSPSSATREDAVGASSSQTPPPPPAEVPHRFFPPAFCFDLPRPTHGATTARRSWTEKSDFLFAERRKHFVVSATVMASRAPDGWFGSHPDECQRSASLGEHPPPSTSSLFLPLKTTQPPPQPYSTCITTFLPYPLVVIVRSGWWCTITTSRQAVPSFAPMHPWHTHFNSDSCAKTVPQLLKNI